VKMPVWKAAFLVLLVVVSGLDQKVTDEQLRKLFARMDADANGKLSVDEILHLHHETQKSAAARQTPGIVQEVDANKDGQLSLKEIIANMYGGSDDENLAEQKARDKEMFEAADGDDNGLLNAKEAVLYFRPDVYDNVAQVVAQQTMDDQDENADGSLDSKEFWSKMEGGPQPDDLEKFKKLDKNGNGKIDMKELLPWESGRIHIMHDFDDFMQFADSDGDKHLSVEELLTIDEIHTSGADEENNAKFHLVEMIRHHEL